MRVPSNSCSEPFMLPRRDGRRRTLRVCDLCQGRGPPSGSQGSGALAVFTSDWPPGGSFLGFTHHCARQRSNGAFIVWRQTAKKRMVAKLQAIKTELIRRRHEPIPVVREWLQKVTLGYYRYHAVPGNLPRLQLFRRRLQWLWRQVLLRRSQRGQISWEQLDRWAPARSGHNGHRQRCVDPDQKMYFRANCNWRMSKAVPRTKPAAVTMSRICPKFGAGFGLLPPQFIFGLASAGWFGMLNVSKRS
jgi:hypothetical protein